MKILLQTLFFAFLAFSITSCDDDDDETMEPNPPTTTVCTQAATYLVDGVEICSSGSFTLGNGSSTAVNLVGANNELLSIVVLGAGEQAFAIPAGNASYTSADGTMFTSTSGGLFTVTQNSPTLDATFSFDAQSSGGATVSITTGVIVGLPQ
jgi:hypothetical protein